MSRKRTYTIKADDVIVVACALSEAALKSEREGYFYTARNLYEHAYNMLAHVNKDDLAEVMRRGMERCTTQGEAADATE